MPIKAIVNGVEKEITRIPVLAHDIETATGTNSVTFNTSSDRVIGCDISGNTQQTGTPAPDTPIIPTFCGNKTDNLFPLAIAQTITNNGITLETTGDGIYHIFGKADVDSALKVQLLTSATIPVSVGSGGNGTVSFFNSESYKSGKVGFAFVLSDIVVDGWSMSEKNRKTNSYVGMGGKSYDSFSIHISSGIEVDFLISPYITDTGEFPNTYKPYGYKLPITNAGQTQNVYLGEVPTTRKIKKLVLTGGQDESWTYNIAPGSDIYRARFEDLPNAAITECICSHYKYRFENADGNIFVNSTLKQITFCDNINATDDTTWRAYLAAQYAAGTPVTVWFVLAEPETGIVNEPLCKIDMYADELHTTDAGVTIPTIKGTNTLTVDTTLSPSSTTVTYRGTTTVYKDAWEVRDNQDRLLWYREDTLTGTSSIAYKGYGIPLKSMSVLGNGQQNGTPAPDAPIMPTFCGNRTENLFDGFDYYGVVPSINDGKNANYNKGASTDYIKIDNPLITLSKDSSFANARIYIFLYNENKTFIGYAMSDDIKIVSWNISNYVSAKFARIRVDGYGQYVEQYMLNLGSTPLSYEPFGWKIPVTSAGQTQNVYLGEAPTVRRIKKLVLTGNETGWSVTTSTTESGTYVFSIRYDAIGMSDIINRDEIMTRIPYPQFYSTHFKLKSNIHADNHYRDIKSGEIGANNVVMSGENYNRYIIFATNQCSTVTDFIQFLADQYSAGTPVTVWYILAESVTGIVNEPLCKIDTYVDELITVPGITPQTGTNTLTVDTTLSPSSVSITGHIKETV